MSVELPENVTNETFTFESYGFQLFDIDANTFDEVRDIYADLGPLESVTNLSIPTNITFSSSDSGGENVAVYVQVVNDGGSSEGAPFRMSVVAYRQENLFKNDTSLNGTGVDIVSVVMSVSSTAGDETTLILGFQPLRNGNEDDVTQVS